MIVNNIDPVNIEAETQPKLHTHLKPYWLGAGLIHNIQLRNKSPDTDLLLPKSTFYLEGLIKSTQHILVYL